MSQACKRGRHTLCRVSIALFLSAPICAWSACTISADGVNFGSYDASLNQDSDSAGNISVNCDSGAAYTLALSAGGGSYTTRVMNNGAFALNYNLYTDAARTFVWGDGSGATATVGGSGTGTATNIAVYGRIPARQHPHVGSYSDNIVVTVSF